MGVAYYANYFVWFEVARCDLLRSVGTTYRELETEGFMLPVTEAHCEYRDSARYDDELEIATTGSLRSAVRVTFEYEVTRRTDGAPLAVGRTMHAAVDLNGRPTRLPPHIQEVLL